MPVLWTLLLVVGALAAALFVKAAVGVGLALLSLLLYPFAIAEDMKFKREVREAKARRQKLDDDFEREMDEYYKRKYWGDDDE